MIRRTAPAAPAPVRVGAPATRPRDEAPAAIICADIHLSARTPVARVDDYTAAQEAKLTWLQRLQRELACPVIDGGDVFDHWKAPPWLSALAYRRMPADLFTVPGNHDLPEHALTRYPHSALHLLGATRDDVTVMNVTGTHPLYMVGNYLRVWAYPNGVFDPKALAEIPKARGYRDVLVLHEFVWPGLKPPWHGAPGYMAQALLRVAAAAGYDLVVCGDNHKAFVESYEDTLLVNPGSMMRSTADQSDYRPRCYLYYAKSHQLVPEYYPVAPAVITDEHLTRVQERDARVAAYIEHMNTQWAVGLSFRANLEAFLQANPTPRLVKELIWQHMDRTPAS